MSLKMVRFTNALCTQLLVCEFVSPFLSLKFSLQCNGFGGKTLKDSLQHLLVEKESSSLQKPILLE